MCPLCKEGKPTKIQATNWNDKIGVPVHVTEEYPYFKYCNPNGRDLPYRPPEDK